MATGANIQPGRGNVTTNLSPTVDLRTGDAEAWDTVRRVADRYTEANKPNLIRRAQARGAEEGAAVAAGEMAMPDRGILFGGDVAEARTAALGRAYTARISNDIDAREAELRREHRHDPEAYERAAGEMLSGFIQGSEPEFAVEVETYGRSLIQRGHAAVAGARSTRDEQETVQALGVRAETLKGRLIALASKAGGIGSEEYNAAWQEYSDLQDDRANNPAVLYSEEQRVADDAGVLDGVQSADVGRRAVEEYRANGGSMAAALRFLQANVLEGDVFEGVAPERVQAIYQNGLRSVQTVATADREARREQAEADRVRRDAERDARDVYTLRIAQGDLPGVDEIQNDDRLGVGDRATLLRLRDSARRREEEQARRDERLERQESRDTYLSYSDEARAGTLSRDDIAAGIESGQLSRGQGRRLQALADSSLAPVVADVMAPVRDALSGRTQRGARTTLAHAEEAAIEWARLYPNASFEDRIRAGEFFARRYAGGVQSSTPTQGTPAQSQSTALRDLENERGRRRSSGNPMSPAEYRRRRNEIANGR